MSEWYASEMSYSEVYSETSNQWFALKEVKKKELIILYKILFCNDIYSNVILPVIAKRFSLLLVI